MVVLQDEEKVSHQGLHLSRRGVKAFRNAVHHHGILAEGGNVKAQLLKQRGMLLNKEAAFHAHGYLHRKQCLLAKVGTVGKGLQETVVQDPFPCPPHMHYHEPGSALGEDVLPLHHQHLRRGKGPVLEQGAVILALINVPGSVVFWRKIGLAGHLLERIIIQIQSCVRNGRWTVFLETGAHDGNLPGLRIVKFYGTGHAALSHGFLDGSQQGLEQHLVFLELDFRLCGMDVHVYGGGIHIQVDEIGRGASFRDEVFVGLHHGLVEVRAPEVSAVHKEELVPNGLPGTFRTAHEAPHGGNGGIGRYIHDVTGDGGPQQVLDAEFQGFCGFEDMDVLAVVGEGEGQVRAG